MQNLCVTEQHVIDVQMRQLPLHQYPVPAVTMMEAPRQYCDHAGVSVRPAQQIPAYNNMTPVTWQDPHNIGSSQLLPSLRPLRLGPHNPLVTPTIGQQYHSLHVNIVTHHQTIQSRLLTRHQSQHHYGGHYSHTLSQSWVPPHIGAPPETQVMGHEEQPPPLVNTVPGYQHRQIAPSGQCDVHSVFKTLQPISQLNYDVWPTQVLVVYKSDLGENIIKIRSKLDMVKERNNAQIKKVKNRLRMIRYKSNGFWKIFDIGEISAGADINKINLYTEVLSSQQAVKRFSKMRIFTLVRQSKSELSLLPSDKDYIYNLIISDYKNSYTIWLNNWINRVVVNATIRNFAIKSWEDIDNFIIYHLYGDLLSELQENVMTNFEIVSGGTIGIREEFVKCFPTLRLLKSYIYKRFELAHSDIQRTQLEPEKPSKEFVVNSSEGEYISRDKVIDFIFSEWLGADNYTEYEEVIGTPDPNHQHCDNI